MKWTYIVSAMLLLISGCHKENNSPRTQFPAVEAKNSAVYIRIPMSDAPPEARKLIGFMERPGSDTLWTDLAVTPDSATGHFRAVPPGEWHLAVNAYDADGALRYSGETVVKAIQGKVASAVLTLRPARGSVNVAVTWEKPGKAGNAIVLNGVNDFLEVASSRSLSEIDTAITIEAWVKPLHQFYNYVLTKGGQSLQYTMELMNENYPSFSLNGLAIDYTGAQEYWSRLVVPHGLLEGRWSHLAMSYSVSGGIKVYLNGALLHHANASGLLKINNDRLRIGALLNNQYELFFHGALDDIRIWNVARSQKEIFQNSKSELTGTEPGLVGYWKFNENTGAAVAIDASLFHNHGAIHGAPLFVKSDAF